MARVSCDSVVAYDPNPVAFPYLQTNLARITGATAHQAGVADRSGRGRLMQPAHDADEHARYVCVSESGDFPVERVDDHPSATGSLIIKIDTEGTERDVIHSAREELITAVAAVVGFEAHHSAIASNGVDPREVINSLPESDRWHVTIAEYPDVCLDMARPLAPQLPAVS